MAINNTKAQSLNFGAPVSSSAPLAREVIDPEVIRRYPDTKKRLEAYEAKALELARQYNIDTLLIACEQRGVELVSITARESERMTEFVGGVCDYLTEKITHGDIDSGGCND